MMQIGTSNSWFEVFLSHARQLADDLLLTMDSHKTYKKL